MDEFQDIQRIKGYETILGSIRSVIQRQPNTSYIFCGSLLNRMNDFFSDRKSAFYNSAEFSDFLSKRFKLGGCQPEAGAVQSIIDFCRGNPGDIRRLCIGIWAGTLSGDSIDEKAVLNGVAHICSLESDSFRDKLDSLSRNQILCLGSLLQEKDILLKGNRSWVMSNPFFFYWLHLPV